MGRRGKKLHKIKKTVKLQDKKAIEEKMSSLSIWLLGTIMGSIIGVIVGVIIEPLPLVSNIYDTVLGGYSVDFILSNYIDGADYYDYSEKEIYENFNINERDLLDIDLGIDFNNNYRGKDIIISDLYVDTLIVKFTDGFKIERSSDGVKSQLFKVQNYIFKEINLKMNGDRDYTTTIKISPSSPIEKYKLTIKDIDYKEIFIFTDGKFILKPETLFVCIIKLNINGEQKYIISNLTTPKSLKNMESDEIYETALNTVCDLMCSNYNIDFESLQNSYISPNIRYKIN